MKRVKEADPSELARRELDKRNIVVSFKETSRERPISNPVAYDEKKKEISERLEARAKQMQASPPVKQRAESK